MSPFTDRLLRLRLLAWIEGISFLVLLFVAMPMKYLADQPMMVRYTGLVHGLLFVLFVLSAIQAKTEYDWSGGRLMRVIGTAFIPFGMIVFDRMQRPAKEVRV